MKVTTIDTAEVIQTRKTLQAAEQFLAAVRRAQAEEFRRRQPPKGGAFQPDGAGSAIHPAAGAQVRSTTVGAWSPAAQVTRKVSSPIGVTGALDELPRHAVEATPTRVNQTTSADRRLRGLRSEREERRGTKENSVLPGWRPGSARPPRARLLRATRLEP